ncbi:Uncharacterized protein FWK35_00026180, partial [Aphis craccivora]
MNTPADVVGDVCFSNNGLAFLFSEMRILFVYSKRSTHFGECGLEPD